MFHTMYVAILFIYMVSALSQSTAQWGVYLEFKGQRLNSTSEVVLSDIGEQSTGSGTVDTARGDALVCVTDKSTCCRAADGASSTGDGGWFFPSMTPVPNHSVPLMGIYRSRGTGFVRLNRQSDSTYEGTGMFCCEVPDMAGITQKVCVNVVLTLPPTAPPTTPPSMTTGVYLEFKGHRLNSTSEVVLSDIGELDTGSSDADGTARGDALVCVTDNSICCRVADGAPAGGTGEWFLPSMTVPGVVAPFNGIYRTRGTGLVRLNRQSDSTFEGVGMFCCEVPDMANMTQRVCVNVVVTLPPTAPPTTPPSMTTVNLPTTLPPPTTPPPLSTTTVQCPTLPPDQLASHNTLVGVIAFLCIVVVILMSALIAALCYIFWKHKSANGVVNMELNVREPTQGDVTLKSNEAYGEVNRSEPVASVYEEIHDIVQYQNISDIAHASTIQH